MAAKTDEKRLTITFSLGVVLNNRLQTFLKESGLSKSSVIREAIDLYLRSKAGDNN